VAGLPGTCIGGRCQLVCPAGTADCDGIGSNGCEVNVNGDVQNCGGCGIRCPTAPNAVASCQNGVCALACQPGFSDCNANMVDGCEVSLINNPSHCGSCFAACAPQVPNGASVCQGGVCRAVCNTPFLDCNNFVVDGCEVNSQINPQNCGVCGRVCPQAQNGASTCVDGDCSVSCYPPFRNCDNNLVNGCEINTGNDPQNVSLQLGERPASLGQLSP